MTHAAFKTQTLSSSTATKTLSITLTVEISEVQTPKALLIADSLRSALKQASDEYAPGSQIGVAISLDSKREAKNKPSTPLRFQQLPGQSAKAIDPSSKTPASVLKPKRSGQVSPNSPALRDAKAARLRLLKAANFSAVSPSSASELGSGNLVIDLYGRRVRIDGADIDFTHKEFELLAFLARNARQAINRDQLMSEVWGDTSGQTQERTVDVHVRRVRNKLGRYRRLISTVRGSGYRLDPGSDVCVIGHSK